MAVELTEQQRQLANIVQSAYSDADKLHAQYRPLWEERYRGVCEGSVSFDLVSPHASRVVALRPADDQPRVVGATAHIGCGALDVVDQRWDPSSSTLTVATGPAGRRRRRLVVWTGGRDATATVAGVAAGIAGDGPTRSIELELDAQADVVWRLNPS